MSKKEYTFDCATCKNKGLSSFCTLKTDELELLSSYKTTALVRKHETLFFESDTVRGLHCVHSGKLKLYKTLNDGTVRILRIAGESELIGYRGLLGNGKYIASAEALEDSLVCFIPKEHIYRFIHSNLDFALKLMSIIADDISIAEDRAVNYAQKSSRERLAEAILLFEHSFGTTAAGFIDIRLTREEIAAFTGMAVETCVRILHAWESENIVALHRKHIRLVNKSRLLEISAAQE